MLVQEASVHAFLERAPLTQVIAATRRRIKQALWTHLAADRLTPQQYWLLMVLMEHGPHSLHDLAAKVWVDDPTACRIVKALAGRGLVSSGPDPDHGRRILIRLAPGTEGLQQRLRSVAKTVRGAMEAGLGEQERAQLRSSLMKMMANLDALDGGGKRA